MVFRMSGKYVCVAHCTAHGNKINKQKFSFGPYVASFVFSLIFASKWWLSSAQHSTAQYIISLSRSLYLPFFFSFAVSFTRRLHTGHTPKIESTQTCARKIQSCSCSNIHHFAGNEEKITVHSFHFSPQKPVCQRANAHTESD